MVKIIVDPDDNSTEGPLKRSLTLVLLNCRMEPTLQTALFLVHREKIDH